MNFFDKNNLNEKDIEVLKLKNDFSKSHIILEWIKNNPKKALSFRGKQDETLLHWAVLTSLNNTKVLINELNFDLNQTDKNGLTPLDWIVERYFVHVVLNNQNISEKGRVFLLNQTNDIAIFLYENNAKTKYDLIDIFSKTGSYHFIDYIFRKEGIYKLVNIGESEKSILHNWVLNGESLSKHQKLIEILETYKININIQDKEGLTPLFYAVDGWIVKPQIFNSFWKPLIKSLLRKGADPYLKSKRKFIDENNNEIFLSPINLFDENNPKEKIMLKSFKKLIENNEKMLKNPKLKDRLMEKEYKKYIK